MLAEEDVEAPVGAVEGTGCPVLVLDPVQCRFGLDEGHHGDESAPLVGAQRADLFVALDECQRDVCAYGVFVAIDDSCPFEGVAFDRECQVVDGRVSVRQAEVDDL